MLDRQSVPNVDCSFDSWKRFDCYDESEVDPAYSRAIESSLWEIDALGNHWCQAVGFFFKSSVLEVGLIGVFACGMFVARFDETKSDSQKEV